MIKKRIQCTWCEKYRITRRIMNMDLCTKCFEEWRRKKRDENHEFLMKLHKQNQKKVSNCCSAKIYDELDICTSCKEHCKGVLENGER